MRGYAATEEERSSPVGITDALGGALVVSNFCSLNLFFNFHILPINPFPNVITQADNQANQPTVEVFYDNNYERVESKME